MKEDKTNEESVKERILRSLKEHQPSKKDQDMAKDYYEKKKAQKRFSDKIKSETTSTTKTNTTKKQAATKHTESSVAEEWLEKSQKYLKKVGKKIKIKFRQSRQYLAKKRQEKATSSGKAYSRKHPTLSQIVQGAEEMSEPNSYKYLRRKENRIAKRIYAYVVIGFLTIMVGLGLGLLIFWQNGQKPLQPESNKTKLVEIPLGSSNKQIAGILESQKIIRSGTVFHYYMKLHNQSDFQAGFYKLAPNMTLDHIAKVLKEGLTSQQVLTIPEGYSIDQIADSLEKKTPFKKDEFLKYMADDAFYQELLKDFPDLLQSSSEATDERFKLEGYLFPATYSITPGGDLKDLIYQMVNKSNQVLSGYYEEIKNKGMTVHEVLTLASLVEKEGIKEDDRKKIAGVFFNRLEIGMPIQSDIAILYAKGEYKEKVSIEDTKVDSPYNLYIHTGFGPGPYNSPSEAAINAVLHPTQSDYYYFVADVTTGMVYFSSTLDEHNVLVEKYVNNH